MWSHFSPILSHNQKSLNLEVVPIFRTLINSRQHWLMTIRHQGSHIGSFFCPVSFRYNAPEGIFPHAPTYPLSFKNKFLRPTRYLNPSPGAVTRRFADRPMGIFCLKFYWPAKKSWEIPSDGTRNYALPGYGSLDTPGKRVRYWSARLRVVWL